MRTFVSLCRDGVFLKEKWNELIDMDIDRWHTSRSPLPLHQYLGMTWEEYCIFAISPSKLSEIIEKS